MELGLAGKNVVITGAAMGIGRSIAEQFVAEGAFVGLVDIDGDALADVAGRLGTKVATGVADLSTRFGVESGLGAVMDDLGDVDVLVNNVGAGYVRSFDSLDDADWMATFELNFLSYVRATRLALPGMRERGGAIVNVASDLALQPEAVPIDYSASKAAVLSLTKALARAEGPRVRVNAVAPGPVWTPFWTKPGGFADTMAEAHGMEREAAVAHEMALRQMPMNRLGTPEEVASVVVFLASDRASFVTSSTYGVDGGTIRGL